MNDINDITVHVDASVEELNAVMVFDIQLRRPGASVQEWADELGVSPAFLRRVMQSDEYNDLIRNLQAQHRQRVLLALERMTPQALEAMRTLLETPTKHPMATAKALDVWRSLMTDFVLASTERSSAHSGPVRFLHQVVTQVYTGVAPDDNVVIDVLPPALDGE